MQCNWCLDEQSKKSQIQFLAYKSCIFKDLLICNTKIVKNIKQDLSQQHRISLKKHDLFKNHFLTVHSHQYAKENSKSPVSTSVMSRSGCEPQQQQLSNRFFQPINRYTSSPRYVSFQCKPSIVVHSPQQSKQKQKQNQIIIPNVTQYLLPAEKPIFSAVQTTSIQIHKLHKQRYFQHENNNNSKTIHNQSTPIKMEVNEYPDKNNLINEVKYCSTQKISLTNSNDKYFQPHILQNSQKNRLYKQLLKYPINNKIEEMVCKNTLSVGNGSVEQDEDQFSQVIFGYRKNIHIMSDSLTSQTPKQNISILQKINKNQCV